MCEWWIQICTSTTITASAVAALRFFKSDKDILNLLPNVTFIHFSLSFHLKKTSPVAREMSAINHYSDTFNKQLSYSFTSLFIDILHLPRNHQILPTAPFRGHQSWSILTSSSETLIFCMSSFTTAMNLLCGLYLKTLHSESVVQTISTSPLQLYLQTTKLELLLRYSFFIHPSHSSYYPPVTNLIYSTISLCTWIGRGKKHNKVDGNKNINATERLIKLLAPHAIRTTF